ncbi:uncharacterized protein LOC132752216 [Ruditapes philippinarum]|uniref:uncharacterized protein LOC132752216 n=1 Tax=Ruditapes philippinarum TaxID=129788 RepID=UPI00295B8B30|nr:uncharacterized protein LOC132752216 [Ruditapes philippinarum]
MNKMLLLGIALTGGALLLCIVATAIPYWWSSDAVDVGLFRVCGSTILGNKCLEYSDTPDWLDATRAMMILAILSLGASILMSILFGFIMKERQFLAILSALLCFAGAGLTILGVIIFGSKHPGDLYKVLYGDGSLHAGFGLAIIAAIAAGVSGMVVFLAKGRNV